MGRGVFGEKDVKGSCPPPFPPPSFAASEPAIELGNNQCFPPVSKPRVCPLRSRCGTRGPRVALTHLTSLQLLISSTSRATSTSARRGRGARQRRGGRGGAELGLLHGPPAWGERTSLAFFYHPTHPILPLPAPGSRTAMCCYVARALAGRAVTRYFRPRTGDKGRPGLAGLHTAACDLSANQRSGRLGPTNQRLGLASVTAGGSAMMAPPGSGTPASALACHFIGCRYPN